MGKIIRLDAGVKTLNDVTAADKKYIEKMYEDVKKEIQRQTAALGINPNRAVSDSLEKYRLRELEKSIDKNLAEIRTSTEKHIIGSMNTVSQAVAQGNADWLSSLGVNLGGTPARVPPDIVANLVSGKVYADNWQFSKRIWGDYRASKGDISNIVARGIAENKSTYAIAKDLEKYVSPNAAKPWDWEKVYPGSKQKIDYNAQRMARTLVAHAYQQSVIETSKRNPYVSMVEWRSAMEKRTCPLCEQRNGQHYPLDSVPMDHPNGLCCIFPILDKSTDEIVDELHDWIYGNGSDETNAKMDEYISYLGYEAEKIKELTRAAAFSVGKTLFSGVGTANKNIGNGVDRSGESGIIKSTGNVYSFEEYYENPLLLGETTHKEKYDYFTSHGFDVRPLGKGSYEKISYEEGGGYRVFFGDNQSVLSYHPKPRFRNTHHHGKDEYYKLSTGGGTGKKTKRWFDMAGNEIKM